MEYISRIKYFFLLVLTIYRTFSVSVKCEFEKCQDWRNPGQYYEHTMCQYTSGYSETCNDVLIGGLNKSEEVMILDYHNELRQKVASGAEIRGINGSQPAGNITNLKWDEKAAEIAQRWANQCLFSHDNCRNYDGVRIGQNIGFKASTNHIRNFSDIIQYWYDEVEEFDYNLISNYQHTRKHITFHYTQLIWGNTTHVGCGGVRYKNTRGLYSTHFVCNYRPAGNQIGDAVYKIKPEIQLQTINQ
ncbi:hypothetical protein PV327_001441 [Microctonus hyperodae]|uniref:SCP domain-containing protein n=1 Tax=Microctonus hyperodae TaxID=165561 RepID=A0AA39G979_MICHY|nr:hypothetical protein PV327_001441 [Microctonus hyperodae]